MPLVNCAIICGDSRNRLTEQCLRSWWDGTDKTLCDLTVIDNATGPATRGLLEMLRDEYCFQLLRVDASLGGGAVTNRVLNAARRDQGRFLYHTASDFYFQPGWLDGLVANWELAEALGIGVLGAYSHPFHRTNATMPGLGGYAIHLKDMVAAGSWFMPWAVWDRFGPLNELHHGNWVGSEDSEFNFRLIAARVGRATLVPEMTVHTGRTAANGQPTLGADYMPDIAGVLIE